MLALWGHFSHISVCEREGIDGVAGEEYPGRGVPGRQSHRLSVPAGMELLPVSLTRPKSETSLSPVLNNR